MKIASAVQMREMDRQTIEDYHVPSILLMEHAALAVAQEIDRCWPPLSGKRIAVLCGKGNNGGDGLAVARLLTTRYGAVVTCWLAVSPEELKGDAAANYAMAQAYGITLHQEGDLDLSSTELVVDALLGTGLIGAATGRAAGWIEAVNTAGVPVVAVDIPSGVQADTGQAEGPAIRAAMTVTFALPKYGLLDFPGAEYAGEVVVREIGMPRLVMQADSIQTFRTDASDVAQWLPPRVNGRDSNKGKFGHVMVFAGSGGFVGAPVMVSEAAARMGAGLVTLMIPEGIHPAAMARVSPVVMTRGLPQSSSGTFGKQAIDAALELTSKAAAAAIGPGLGEGEEAAEFVRAFVARCPVPLVVDADALNLLSQEGDHGASVVKSRRPPTIMTPHPGEMGRLLGISTEAVQAERRTAVQQAAQNYGCVVLLKGARTLITAPEGTLYLNTTSNPGMATGGSGDVLTGVLAALLAQKLDPLPAAAAGVYLHGLAGDLVAAAHGGDAGLIATDLIAQLPCALAHCQKGLV